MWAAATSRPATAEQAPAPALQLRCDAGLPFTQQELAAALTLRLADPSADYAVTVRALDLGLVEVSLGDRRRVVYLSDRRDSSAARWVALAVLDLITQEAPPPQLPPPPLPPSAVPPPRLLLLLYPTFGLGVAANPVLVTGGLGGSLRVYRGLRWTAEAGYGGSPKARLHEVEVDYQELPLRSGPAWHLQRVPLELRLSAVVIPYWVRAMAAAGEAQYAGVLAGGGAALFAYLPRSSRLLAVVALGAEFMASRAEFLVRGQPTFDTTRFTVWLGVGLALRSVR